MRQTLFLLTIIFFCACGQQSEPTTSNEDKVVAPVDSIVKEDKSEIEKIIIDEDFIKSKIAGHTSVKTENNKDYKISKKIYLFKDSSSATVIRDSLNKIIAWLRMDKNGQRLETAEVYSTTGQIKGKINYVSGQIEGEVKYYYDNGQVSSKGLFKNGHWWGQWKNYDKDGNFTAYEDYKK